MVLPKKYLFKIIPIKPSPNWYKSLDSYISKFLWNNMPPRISLTFYRKQETVVVAEGCRLSWRCSLAVGSGLVDSESFCLVAYHRERGCLLQLALPPHTRPPPAPLTYHTPIHNRSVARLPTSQF